MMKMQDNTGFTLIEVMIAVAVLAIGILSLNSMQVTSISGNTTASHLTEATVQAMNLIERIQALPYDAASNGQDDDGDGLADEPDEQILQDPSGTGTSYSLAAFAANGIDDNNDGTVDDSGEGDPSGYQISWVVRDNWPVSNARQCTVTVNFVDRGVTRTVTLSTIKLRTI